MTFLIVTICGVINEFNLGVMVNKIENLTNITRVNVCVCLLRNRVKMLKEIGMKFGIQVDYGLE